MEAVIYKTLVSVTGILLKPVWVKKLGDSLTSLLWRRCLKTAGKNADLDESVLNRLDDLAALKRLMVNTFKPDRPVPSALDFAIAISFEFNQHRLICAGRPSFEEIRHFAVELRREWLKGIIESSALRQRFQFLRDAHPANFLQDNASCLSSNDALLGNRTLLAVRYFEGFSSSDSTEKVKVWLPDDAGIVHYDPVSSKTVTVAVNTSQGTDQGFFRVGYDYSIEGSGAWLQVCFFNGKTKMEAAQFGRYSVGRATKQILWAK
ncbi:MULTISPECIES: hypothetical protein [Pseudomonas]|uniref:hypothetical protein n=1 Tax=Pseudomonas TaxID=286 RepID=UPI0002702E70|nr:MULTISPECIES: hypothetical protein [Pseudomonas]EJM26840.1 hypothetical protein PMI24_03406 [Pseudomonas sp. GM25]MCU0092157.1 hypothetical protein [Pseudomonas koreensis]